MILRRGATILAVAATAVVFQVTSTTNGISGAARVLFTWPALSIIAYLVWSWRAGGL